MNDEEETKTIYVWQTEGGNPCAKCQNLNGKTFDEEVDVETLTHPNCQCELIEQEVPMDFECDFGSTTQAAKEVKSFDKDVEQFAKENDLSKKDAADILLEPKITNESKFVQYDATGKMIRSWAEKTPAGQIVGATQDFRENKHKLEQLAANNKKGLVEGKMAGTDKYYHAKANAQATSRGPYGLLTANVISAGREVRDTYKNTKKGMSLKESLLDSKEDYQANFYGQKQGLLSPKKLQENIEKKYLKDKNIPLPKKYL